MKNIFVNQEDNIDNKNCKNNIDVNNVKNYFNPNTDFNLYDLFGNNIEPTETYPFIIISSNNILNLLLPTSFQHIYKYNLKLIQYILKSNDVEDFSQYVSPGYVYAKSDQPTQLLLLNKTICVTIDINKLHKISSLKNGSIWTDGAKYLSLFITESDHISQDDIKDIYTIDPKLLTKYKNKQNEFFLLNFGETSFTIDRNIFKKSSYVMKIMANNNNYITYSDGKLILKSKNTSNKNQEVNYTVQGELKLGDKCITNINDTNTLNDDLNSSIKLDECTNEDIQKWYDLGKKECDKYSISKLKFPSVESQNPVHKVRISKGRHSNIKFIGN